MPVFNAERFVGEAINSVLNQTHQNWELIVVNDGSTDRSAEIIQRYKDDRIKYFEQENHGVSYARNKGLTEMQGNFLCFLDADDLLTEVSLSSRLEKFSDNKELTFVDGKVLKVDEERRDTIGSWQPSYYGNPIEDLVALGGRSFVGISWMIKNPDNGIRFREDMTHGEDLLYYIEWSRRGGLYDFTDEVILKYRIHTSSAMSSLGGLGEGYRKLYHHLQNLKLSADLIKQFRSKVRSIMFKSYLRKGNVVKALSWAWKV